MQCEVTDSDAWYVRGGLHRVLTMMEDQVTDAKTALEENPDIAGTIKMSVEGMISYNEQWLREAREAFGRLPKELSPL